jgi:hypothetical protein
MTARGLIAHGGPQRLPTRAAPPDSRRSLRVARGAPPWTPWTIRSRLDRPHHDHATYAYVGGVERRDRHAGLLPPVISVITITGIGDHLQPEWLITFTGMRTRAFEQGGLEGLDGPAQAGAIPNPSLPVKRLRLQVHVIPPLRLIGSRLAGHRRCEVIGCFLIGRDTRR